MSTGNAQFVNARLIRQDAPPLTATKLTTLERLDYGFKKIISDGFLSPRSLWGFSTFMKYMKPIDPSKGYGYEIVGGGFPLAENPLKVGDHLIARIHDQFPIMKGNFNNRFTFRVTWSDNKSMTDTMSVKDLSDYYEKQMIAFGNSMRMFLSFLFYKVFQELPCSCPAEKKCASPCKQPCGAPCTQGCDQTTLPECYCIPEFRQFEQDIYNPSSGSTSGYPFYKEYLALEYHPTFCANQAPARNTHTLEDHIKSLRRRLVQNCVTYSPLDATASHDLQPPILQALAMQNKIREIVLEMKLNCGKWRLSKQGMNNIAIGPIQTEDLIVVMNPKTRMFLENGYPLILYPKASGFSASDLGVGSVLEVPFVTEGTAYILHKELFQFIIDDSEVNSAEYAEHRVTNTWARIGVTMDLIEIFPAAVLCCCCTPCAAAA